MGPGGVTVAEEWAHARCGVDTEVWRAAASRLAGGGPGPARRLVHLRDVVAKASGGENTPDPSALFAIVQDLVDEGSPEEIPLLRRAEALRRQIAARAGEPTEPPTDFDLLGEADALFAEALTGEDPLLRVGAAARVRVRARAGRHAAHGLARRPGHGGNRDPVGPVGAGQPVRRGTRGT